MTVSEVSLWRLRAPDAEGALEDIVSHLFFTLFILISCFRGLMLSGIVWRKFLPSWIQSLTSSRCTSCFFMKLDKR